MGLMRCFAKHNSLALPAPESTPAPPAAAPAPRAMASPSPKPPKSTPKSTPRKRQVVRAPDRVEALAVAPTSPKRSFVPRTVAELHPEYSHSEPYHFTANTDSCRMVVSSAAVAARRAGDLRVRAQVVPSPPKPKQIIVRGPQYSARVAKAPPPVDENDGKENAGGDEPSHPSNVELIVERPRTYLADMNEATADNGAARGISRKLMSPLFRRAGSKRTIAKSASPSPAKAASARKQSSAAKALNFDDAEEKPSALLQTFNATPKAANNLAKPVPTYPGVDRDESAADPDETNEDHESIRRDFVEVPNTFDESDVFERHADAEDEYAADDESEDGQGCEGCADCQNCGREEAEEEDDDRYDEYMQASDYEEDETEYETETERSLKQRYPDDRTENESDNESSQPAVSADGFINEDPTASVRSSVRSSVSSAFRSSIRSSVRSSMRSCIDRYSVDSQFHNSVDGDRVASTFDFMRGGSDTEEDDDDISAPVGGRLADRNDGHGKVEAKVTPLRVPRSPMGSFDGSTRGGFDSESDDSSFRQLSAPPPPSPSRQMLRADSSLEHMVEANSRDRVMQSPMMVRRDQAGRGSAANLVPMRSPKRKTVSFRPEKPVVIEPNLRERSVAPVLPAPSTGRTKSALRTTQKPPTAAELAAKRVEDAEREMAERERRLAEREKALEERAAKAQRERDALYAERQDVSMQSPGNSFGSLPSLSRPLGQGMSPSASYNSLPRSMSASPRKSKRLSQRVPSLDREQANRRRSQAVADAVVKQMNGVPRSIMLAYNEHEEEEYTSADENDQDASNGSLRMRSSLRPRARSSKSIVVPEVKPGEVPEPPPPPCFKPTDTRVRSVRRAPPPPSPSPR